MGRYELKPADGSRSNRKRLGRGVGTGTGKTAGKGMKGQRSRSGHKNRPWFEGGQMPLQRRVPKRGFTNIFKKHYQAVNLKNLEGLSVSEIDQVGLAEAGLVRSARRPVKILGEGELTKKINVTADAFSSGARESIEAAGGSCVVQRAVKSGKAKTETSEPGAEV
jgi:large subunit ribosomal protein L15